MVLGRVACGVDRYALAKIGHSDFQQVAELGIPGLDSNV